MRIETGCPKTQAVGPPLANSLHLSLTPGPETLRIAGLAARRARAGAPARAGSPRLRIDCELAFESTANERAWACPPGRAPAN